MWWYAFLKILLVRILAAINQPLWQVAHLSCLFFSPHDTQR